MRFSTEDGFEASHFSHGEVKAVDVGWNHWPLMNVLTSVRGIEVLRSVAFNIYGITDFGGGFLNLIKSLEANSRKAKLLESSSGAVVGCIMLGHDRRWMNKTYLLDVFLHSS